MTRLFIVCCLLLISIILFEPETLAQDFPHRFTTWSQGEGLSQLTIYSIIQDHKGFIWAGTQDGLNRFDGYEFKVYRHDPNNPNSISHNWIWNICEDTHSNLWIASYEGLNLLDRKSNSFTHISPLSQRDKIETSFQPNYLFQENDTLIWVAVWGAGIYWLDPISKKFYADELIPGYLHEPGFQYIRIITKDTDGNILLGTWGDGLKILKREEPLDNTDRSCFTLFPGERITSIQESSDNRIWFGTYDNGIYSGYLNDDAVEQSYFEFFMPDYFTNSYITSLLCDGDENIWIGTLEKGLIIYNRINKILHQVASNPNSNFSLKTKSISSIYLDHHNRIWLGANGLSIYDKLSDQFRAEYPTTGRPGFKDQVVWCFEPIGANTIWIGTEAEGIFHFEPGKGLIKNFHKGNTTLTGNNIRAIRKDRFGKIWIGHFNGGVQVFDKNLIDFKSIELLKDLQVQDMIISPDDWLWIATIREGIYRHHIIENITEKVSIESGEAYLPEKLSTNSLFIDSEDNIWICTHGNGIYIINKNLQLLAHLTRDIQGISMIKSNMIFSVYEEREGTYWLSSHMGIDKLVKIDKTKPLSNANIDLKSKELPAEIANQVAYKILGDDLKRLWVSTNNGLTCFTIETNKFMIYGPEDGLQGYEFNNNAGCITPDGLFFFGGVNGFNYFNPDNINFRTYTTNTCLTKLYISGKETPIDSVHNSKHLKLKYSQSNIAIEYSSFDFPAIGRSLYKTRLAGLEEEWQNQGNRKYINYANLKPGSYTFYVKSSDRYGVFSNNPDTISFRVLSPFWQSWWFISLMILSLGSVIFGWHYYRLQKAVEIEKLRNKLSHDLHDDIGVSLTRISLYSDLLKMDYDSGKKIDYLDKIGKISREVITGMSDIIWATDSNKDHFEDLKDRMNNLLTELTAHLNIDVYFKNTIHENFRLQPHVRQNLYFVYKEALHNAIKHSSANKIDVHMENNSGLFLLSISDNGKGIDLHKKFSGNGLINMQRRAEQIGASFEIENLKGTRVRLTFPFSFLKQ